MSQTRSSRNQPSAEEPGADQPAVDSQPRRSGRYRFSGGQPGLVPLKYAPLIDTGRQYHLSRATRERATRLLEQIRALEAEK